MCLNCLFSLAYALQVRLADLVAEYSERGRTVPYDKIDSPVFEAMFNYLEKEQEDIVSVVKKFTTA